MSILIGAFDPAGTLDDLDIEHAFCRADDIEWGEAVLRDILRRGRTPLISVEPWDNDDPREIGPLWGRLLREVAGSARVFVRFQHECNGTWFPWANKPRAHVADWEVWAFWMPANAVKLWSPNVSFPGTKPLAAYWPGAECVDAIGLSGYARNGETPAELFRPTLDEARALPGAAGVPVWIAETGIKRSRRQARWWRTMMQWAVSEGIEAVIAFNEDKRGQDPDEADWRLTKAAHRALLGRR